MTVLFSLLSCSGPWTDSDAFSLPIELSAHSAEEVFFSLWVDAVGGDAGDGGDTGDTGYVESDETVQTHDIEFGAEISLTSVVEPTRVLFYSPTSLLVPGVTDVEGEALWSTQTHGCQVDDGERVSCWQDYRLRLEPMGERSQTVLLRVDGWALGEQHSYYELQNSVFWVELL